MPKDADIEKSLESYEDEVEIVKEVKKSVEEQPKPPNKVK